MKKTHELFQERAALSSILSFVFSCMFISAILLIMCCCNISLILLIYGATLLLKWQQCICKTNLCSFIYVDLRRRKD